MKILASAPGKLILLGEYAVLEGAPALVMAVNRYAEVTLEPISLDHCLIDAPEIGISSLPFTLNDNLEISFSRSVQKQSKEKLSFFSSTFEYFRQIRRKRLSELPTFKIKLDTSQFFNAEDDQKLGLGSSAALTAGLISALIHFGDGKFESHQSNEIFEAALRAHRNAQGDIGGEIGLEAALHAK